MVKIKGWREGRRFGFVRQWESIILRDGLPSEVGVDTMYNSVTIWSNREKEFVEAVKKFKTQKEALAYAFKWMRKHPKG